jgi:hypothetical protein
MPLVLGGSAVVTPPYSIDNSCRLALADSAYLHYTQGTPTDNLKWTASIWLKVKGVYADTNNVFTCQPSAGNNFQIRVLAAGNLDIDMEVSGSGHVGRLTTNRVFLDPSAWYHIVVIWDSANAAAGDRMKLYVNGVEETSFSTDTNPPLNEASLINADTIVGEIGRRADGAYFDGYMAEAVFIDGLALAASDFGEFNSDSPTIWQPKDVSGLTFGNNGFWLDFKDSADLGNDVSGNSNDFTLVNIAAIDQAIDSPTNNFATANPLSGNAEGYAQGNLKVTDRASTDYSYGACSTIGVIKGKWYMEIKVTAPGSAMFMGLLIGGGEMSIAGDYYASNGTMQYRSDGSYAVYPASSSTGLVTYTTGDIMSMAIDMDNLDVYYYKNGTIENSGAAVFDSSDFTADIFYFPMQVGYNTGIAEYNFGGCGTYAVTSGNADANGYGNFEYAVPTGYYAICTKNLDEFGG